MWLLATLCLQTLLSSHISQGSHHLLSTASQSLFLPPGSPTSCISPCERQTVIFGPLRGPTADPVSSLRLDALSTQLTSPVSLAMMTPRRPRLVRFAHPECWSLCLRRSSPDFSVASGRRPIMAASPAPLSASLLAKLLRVSPQVAEAVERNGPVVALESTIYTHGALGQDLARQHEDLVRSRGGVPAIVAVVDGVPTVGVSPQTIARMVDHGGAMKVSRRDIAYLAGMVRLASDPANPSPPALLTSPPLLSRHLWAES